MHSSLCTRTNVLTATLVCALCYSPVVNGQQTTDGAASPAATSSVAAGPEPSLPAATQTPQPPSGTTAASDPAVAPAPAASEEEQPEQIVIVGSRRVMRSALDSPTPVDMIEASDFVQQAPTDVDRLLRSLVPSYNVNAQPISDAATLIRPANLRGLPPDSTVVLVNGKRRHRGSVIAFLGRGISDGAQGVDLGPIPALALKRVEVLRDGAAAQYGSDAIAGVMNFVLRDSPTGATVTSRVGSTYEGDGTAWSVAANVGLPLTERGFFNFTIEYGNADPTDRSIQRADAAALIEAGNTDVRDPAQIWGTPEISDDLKIFANLGLEVADGVRAYAFGNVARKDVLGGFFFRNPNTRSGVFSNDEGDSLIVGDLTADGSGNCPAIPVVNNVPDISPVAPGGAFDENCFVFNELFPGGFTPQFGGQITDLSIAGGVRGVTDFGLTWDLSAVVGQNEANFRIRNTVNASLGPQTPTEFTPGTYRETDQTYNLDLSYPLDVGTYSPLTIAIGAEYRQEVFTIVAGDSASFEIGPLASQGFGIGSNGFPGFSNDIAGDFDRKNGAGYIDLTTDIIQPWTVQLAGRVESFDTFGTQGVIKASTRLGLSDFFGGGYGTKVAIRGAIGTGFRAPSAGQGNVSNITTEAQGNILRNIGTIPPTNPIAVEVGGKELEPETSLNITGGLVLDLDGFVSLTVDYYNIQVKDRISQSADQELNDEQRARLEALGVRGASDIEIFTFFTNAFDTTTQGIDVVATSQFDFGTAGTTGLSLAYGWNDTEVGDIADPRVIDDERVAALEDTLPNHRFVITGTHLVGPVQILLRGSFYGEFSDPETVADTFYSPRFLVDAEVGYSFLDNLFTVVAGAQNIFNTFPEEYPEATQLSAGYQYPENSPFGFNGGFWYFRLQAQL